MTEVVDAKGNEIKVDDLVVVKYSVNIGDLDDEEACKKWNGIVVQVEAIDENDELAVLVQHPTLKRNYGPNGDLGPDKEWFYRTEVLKVPDIYLDPNKEKELRLWANMAGWSREDV